MKEVQGRRVSSRNRMKPLKWYEGEAKRYCRDHVSAPPLHVSEATWLALVGAPFMAA